MLGTMNNINYKQEPLKYLSHNRFSAIYEMLKIFPSWEILGEIIFREPITQEEIKFTAIKSGIVIS